MHVLLASIGTDGDVFPYFAIGQALGQRGHRVTLLSGERYRALAEQSGFEFDALASEAELQAMLADPDLWHWLKCARVVARWGTAHLERHYRILVEHLGDGETVLVTSPGILGARILHEQRGIPLASVILQPWVIPSTDAPPRLPLYLPRWAPRWLWNCYWKAFHATAHHMIAGDVNRLRASLQLPPVRQIFQWWLSPQLVLGLFPDWFGPPQPDWPAQIRLTGFPLFDGRMRDGLPDVVEKFLAAGEPPVAVTFGTGMRHAAWLFAEVISACQRAGRRALLLTRHSEQLPPSLPAGILAVPYAPFRDLFPRCSAVIHHGGVGTTSQALASAVPQLILPFAFDQPDNGLRVRHLNAGTWFWPRRGCADRIADALTNLAQPAVQAGCRELRALIGASEGPQRAAAEIERQLAR
jgi:UDP:flavonoid glycosyltransferase YjiC (YdhE family)